MSQWGDEGTVPYDPHAATVHQGGETVRFPQRDDSAQHTVAQTSAAPADTGYRPPEAYPSAPSYPGPHQESYHPGSAYPPAPAAASGRPGVPIRIGSGVSGPTPGRSAGRRSGRRWWGRFARLVSTLATVVLVVAAAWTVWQWWHNAHDGVRVTGVAVAPAQQLGGKCDVQYDVVGTIVTNGKSGTISYEWIRSDGQTSGLLKQSIEAGPSATKVHLYWKFTGQGEMTATATLRVLEPNQADGAASFPYSCA